jgi:hypothetical protein
MFFLLLFSCQESPIKIEQCSDLLCDWSEFVDIYQQKISCPFDQVPYVVNLCYGRNVSGIIP